VNLDNFIDFMLVYMSGRSENEYRSGGSSDSAVTVTYSGEAVALSGGSWNQKIAVGDL